MKRKFRYRFTWRSCVLLLLAFFIYVLYKPSLTDIRKQGEAINPVSYVFDFPIEVVEHCIRSFSDSNIYGCYDGNEEFKGIYSINYNANKHPIVNYSLASSSYVYKWKGKFVKDGNFHEVVLHDEGGKTHVHVGRSKPALAQVGEYYLPNPRLGFEFGIPRFTKIKACTIREYELLRFIGKKLGQKGMPPVLYPSARSLKEIQDRYKQKGEIHFPFALDEIQIGDSLVSQMKQP